MRRVWSSPDARGCTRFTGVRATKPGLRPERTARRARRAATGCSPVEARSSNDTRPADGCFRRGAITPVTSVAVCPAPPNCGPSSPAEVTKLNVTERPIEVAGPARSAEFPRKRRGSPQCGSLTKLSRAVSPAAGDAPPLRLTQQPLRGAEVSISADLRALNDSSVAEVVVCPRTSRAATRLRPRRWPTCCRGRACALARALHPRPERGRSRPLGYLGARPGGRWSSCTARRSRLPRALAGCSG